ncbi:branched-chain amino acid ABC transporter permease [Demequina mangrovi]|uniref:Branched-chain amino acid ABC-type transport system, permease component n=1 Tax=Demequina mangrovi TaxID=1043493 RepID=A0A1H6TIX5_9MICO|nr:branched-chain amino acid ABC transporter permease [Demequina mangrovi]SEI80008.1 Branched-chain amino acid ABC-type transport system, permease component [Demequina mangrovi]
MFTRPDKRLYRAAGLLLIAAAAFIIATLLLGGGPADAETVEPVAAGTPTGTLIIQNVINGLAFGVLLALAAVGLSLIFGTTGLSNFAHGEQVTFGALLTFFLSTNEQVTIPLIPGSFSIGLPLWLAAIIAVIVSAGTGWLQDKLLWSPLRRRRVAVLQQMVVSIGLSLALLNLLQWWMGASRHRLTNASGGRITFGDFYIGTQTLMSVIIASIALVAVALFLLKTRLGRATRAISDNPALAAASGIRVDSIIRLVWVMSAALAGLGGILLALFDNGAGFDSGARILLLMFAAVTLGGLGQAFGALVGAIVVGVVSEVSTVVIAPDMRYASALAILIIVLLVRPQGILGTKERVG